MFMPGAKVYVHSSSISGKKLGPKPFSLGYVSENPSSYFVKQMKDFPIQNQGFILSPVSVIFTRYGREQRTRREKRVILTVMPAFLQAKGILVPKRVEEILDYFTDKEFCKNACWSTAAQNYGANCVGVVLPMRNFKAGVMDTEDALAWIEALLRNQEFAGLLYHNRNLPTIKALKIHGDLLKWIADAAANNKTRSGLLSWASDRESNRIDVMNALRALLTAFIKRLHESTAAAWENTMKGGNQGGTDHLTSWFVTGMFENDSLMLKKHQMIKKYPVNRNLADYFDCMRLVRSSYLNLKLSYV